MSEQDPNLKNMESGIYIWIAVVDPKKESGSNQPSHERFEMRALGDGVETVRINPRPPGHHDSVSFETRQLGDEPETVRISPRPPVAVAQSIAEGGSIDVLTVRIVRRVNVATTGKDANPAGYVFESIAHAYPYTLPAFEGSAFDQQYEFVPHMLPTQTTLAEAKAWGEKDGIWLTQARTTVYAFLVFKRFSSENIRLFTDLE